MYRTSCYDAKVTEFYVKYSDKTKKVQIQEELEEEIEEGEQGQVQMQLSKLNVPDVEQDEVDKDTKKRDQGDGSAQSIDGCEAYEASVLLSMFEGGGAGLPSKLL